MAALLKSPNAWAWPVPRKHCHTLSLQQTPPYVRQFLKLFLLECYQLTQVRYSQRPVASCRLGPTKLTLCYGANRDPSKRKLHTLGSFSLELEATVPHVLQYGVMPNQAQLGEADRPDLVQAVRVRG